MTSPVNQAKAQAQTIWPGAIVDGRGRGWIRHRHPTDSTRYMIDAQSGDAGWHFGPGPYTSAHEIDTAWIARTGAWDYEMVKADYNVFARSLFNVGDIFRFQKGTEWVNLSPLSINWNDENYSQQQIAITQAVSAVPSDDVLEFPAGFGAGRHFRYVNDTTKLIKLIEIDSPANLPSVTLQGTTIWFVGEFTISHSPDIQVYLDDVLWTKVNGQRITTVNRVEFRDAATGTNVLWVLDYPRAFDSNGDSVIGEMEVRRDGGPTNLFVTVRIPKTWIDGATFPIYIDPTVDAQVAASADDTAQGFSGGNDNPTLSSFDHGASGSGGWEWTGSRYTGINTAAGATFSNCYQSFHVNQFTSNLSLNCTIYGNDVSSPAQFTGVPNGVSGRPRTTASVAWTASLTNNTFENSPDISTIIDELNVSFGPYSSGVMCIITNATTSSLAGLDQYDGAAANAPKLHLEYSTGDPAIDVIRPKVIDQPHPIGIHDI